MENDYKPENPCEKANYICDKTQYNEANFFEKLKLNLHLLRCPSCRIYAQDNKKLSELFQSSTIDCLNAQEQEEIQHKLYLQLNKIYRNP